MLGYVSKLSILEACKMLNLNRKRKTYSTRKMTIIQTMTWMWRSSEVGEVVKMEVSNILEVFGRQNL